MLKTPEEIRAKLLEIRELRNSGKYNKYEDASTAAGMGKNWYFDNIKKYPIDTTKYQSDSNSIKEIPNDTVSISKKEDKPKKTKNTYRVLISLNKEQYDYFKAKAEKRSMDLSQLLAYGLGEAQEKGLI